MKTTSISYSRGRTLNLGDFESIRIDMGAEAYLDEGETLQEGMETLRLQVNKMVLEEVKVIRKRLEQKNP